jgi:hypothetical protein
MEGFSGISRVALCPSCSNLAPQNLVFIYSFAERRPYDKSFVAPEEAPEHTYFVASCSVCRDLLLYIATYGIRSATDFPTVEVFLLYPTGVELDPSVPLRVRECYDEAVRVQHNAPNAYAVLIRRSLELICEDRGITKGTLKARLEELVQRGEIPSNLVEATTILRTLGNAGAHDGNLSPYTTWAMADFFRAVVEYVYVQTKYGNT